MSLTKHKLGDFVELYNKKCDITNLTCDDVSGINKNKEFFEPSKQVGSDTTDYKVVPLNYFACNLMHVGRDEVLPIAFNHSNNVKYVSPAYTVFCIKEEKKLLKEYFFMMLKSDERDRYFWFHTDSSIRDGMSWQDFCELEINLPDISIQQKYVNIYNTMLVNQGSYERGLSDLKIVFEGYLDELRHKIKLESIGEYIEPVEEKNSEQEYGVDSVRGISIDKKFINTKADMTGVNLSPYYIVQPNEFAYVPVTSRNGEKISLAINDSDEVYICSSSYVVFKSKDLNKLFPQYLMLYFSREEFNRYARFNSWGSVREMFSFADMCDVKIPIPDIKIQKAIANIYMTYIARKKINEHLKLMISNICPILIKGSLEEASI